MNTEYEAMYSNIKHGEISEKLKSIGATLIRERYLQKRTTLQLPECSILNSGWLRVRTDGEKTTLALKQVGGTIEDQKEVEIEVSSYDSTVELMKMLGAVENAVQESYRELWDLKGVEVVLDEWPYLEQFIEIEGQSEEAVRSAVELLGLDWKDAIFDTVTKLYSEKYGISEDYFNNEVKEVLFNKKPIFVR